MTLRHALLVFFLGSLIGSCAPMINAPGPTIRAPALSSGAVLMGDGVELPMRSWLPNTAPTTHTTPPVAVIIALHGFNDYSNFFSKPGAYFASRGIAVYAYDQRGFGGAPERGLWPGIKALIDDLNTVTRLIRARHADIPLYLLGESMGGAVVMTAMAADNPPAVNGIILSAPAVRGRAAMPWYQRGALWLTARIMPGVTVTGQSLNIRASDNTEMLRALGRDPLIIKQTRIDTIWGLVNLMDRALESAAGINAPMLLLYGANDEVIPDAPMRLMISQVSGIKAPDGRNHLRIASYNKGFHMLLRDLQAEIVLADIVNWIDDAGAALPSGADTAGSALLTAGPDTVFATTVP